MLVALALLFLLFHCRAPLLFVWVLLLLLPPLLLTARLQVDHARRHIVDTLLTLKCPQCSAAFLDFNGCFALTCHRCKCGFCGWCLQACGADAHAHVANCRHNVAPNRNVFGTQQQFQQAQRARRQRLVREYLKAAEAGAGGPELRAKVVAACQQDFADLGVEV